MKAKRTKEEQELYKALGMVRALAAKRVNEAVREQSKSETKSPNYYQREIDDAQKASWWCLVQQMRIDPD